MVVTTLPYCDVQRAGLSATTVIGPAWPPSRASPRGKTVRTGSVVVAQSMLRATSMAPPLSLAKIRVQASAYCAAPACGRAIVAARAAAEHSVLNIVSKVPGSSCRRSAEECRFAVDTGAFACPGQPGGAGNGRGRVSLAGAGCLLPNKHRVYFLWMRLRAGSMGDVQLCEPAISAATARGSLAARRRREIRPEDCK
jgi:hypothetical protein